MNSQIFINEILFFLRMIVKINFEPGTFSRAAKLIFIFSIHKTYSIGFNYSLVSIINLAICLLKMTFEDSNVAYFKPFSTLLMVAIFLFNY